MSKKILVAYFSHSGNTRYIAEQIQKSIAGDLFEIKTVKPSPSRTQTVTPKRTTTRPVRRKRSPSR